MTFILLLQMFVATCLLFLACCVAIRNPKNEAAFWKEEFENNSQTEQIMFVRAARFAVSDRESHHCGLFAPSMLVKLHHVVHNHVLYSDWFCKCLFIVSKKTRVNHCQHFYCHLNYLLFNLKTSHILFTGRVNLRICWTTNTEIIYIYLQKVIS